MSNFLDPLLFGVRRIVQGLTAYPPRTTLRFVGATVADDPALEETVVTISGGGGGGELAGDVNGAFDATRTVNISGGDDGTVQLDYLLAASTPVDSRKEVVEVPPTAVGYACTMTLPDTSYGSFTGLAVFNCINADGDAFSWHIESAQRWDTSTNTFTPLRVDTKIPASDPSPHSVSIQWYNDSGPKVRIRFSEGASRTTILSASLTVQKACI